MAEIPVEKKSNLTWLWVLLALLIVAALIWWATDDDGDAVVADDTAVVATADDEYANAATDAAATDATDAAGLTLAAVLASPQQYIGRDDFSGRFTVAEVPTDRGFWIENDGQRMFALIIDRPNEEPKDINPGQTVQITGGMIRSADDLAQIPGRPTDEDTQNIADGQDVVLAVNEENIEIASAE